MSHLKPPRWTSHDLEVARRASIGQFREERLQEPLEQYTEAFDACREEVEDLLEATVDLTELSAKTVRDPTMLNALRYVAGPPISVDDLKVLADASLAPAKLAADSDMASRVVDTVLLALDRRRFPWVTEGREAEPAERDAATLASATLMAAQRLSTGRRNEGKITQEETVARALTEGGYEEVPTRTIGTLSDAPSAGQFCRESLVGSRKADFTIGLFDGRKMPLECKVSNSSTNSIKRLNNDAAAKAERWLHDFGRVQTVPAAVLSGVYKLRNLEAAQEAGLTLFWAYKLDDMLAWIEQTRE